MNAILITIAIAIGTSFIGLLSWLMVAMVKHSTNSNLHPTSHEREAVTKSIEAQIQAHNALDDERFKAGEERFKAVEKLLEEMRLDIKTLLRRRK